VDVVSQHFRNVLRGLFTARLTGTLQPTALKEKILNEFPEKMGLVFIKHTVSYLNSWRDPIL